MKEVADTARREAVKSADTIYDEVVIDEVNEELLKSAQKCNGERLTILASPAMSTFASRRCSVYAITR